MDYYKPRRGLFCGVGSFTVLCTFLMFTFLVIAGVVADRFDSHEVNPLDQKVIEYQVKQRQEILKQEILKLELEQAQERKDLMLSTYKVILVTGVTLLSLFLICWALLRIVFTSGILGRYTQTMARRQPDRFDFERQMEDIQQLKLRLRNTRWQRFKDSDSDDDNWPPAA